MGAFLRFEDWPKRLDAFTRAAQDRPFKWGEWDCVMSCCFLVRELTGYDASGIAYGKYETAAGAYLLLREHGGSIQSLFTAHLGEPVPGLMAQRGDVCLIETELGDAAGWCLGAEIVATGPSGLTRVPLRRAKMAWRV